VKIPELTKEKVEKAISKIDNADLEKITIEELESILASLLTGYKVSTRFLTKDLYLYRGRICDKPSTIRDIIYPPVKRKNPRGRANDVGESLFYAATKENVPLFELNAKEGNYIALSQWKTTEKFKINHIGFSEECSKYLKSNRDLDTIYDFVISTKKYGDINSRVYDYLAFKFSKMVKPGEENYYKLTIAISRKLFKDDMFSGLFYPNIAMAGNADNIVLKTNFADKHLEFKSVKYIEVMEVKEAKEVKDRSYKLKVLDSATKIDNNDHLLWE